MIPILTEIQTWEAGYRALYRTQHRARNQALVEHMAGEDHAPMRVDVAAAHVESGLGAALSLVDEFNHDKIASARGMGYEAGRAGRDQAKDCPVFQSHDLFMAWHAGYVQGTPKSVDKDPATRSRGYIPPQPYFCPLCDAREGQNHTGPKRDHDTKLNFGAREACEDHLVVLRPIRRFGGTFT